MATRRPIIVGTDGPNFALFDPARIAKTGFPETYKINTQVNK